MGVPERPEAALAWDLRGYWASQTEVTVTMTERCMIRTVVGRVSRVAVTGAFAVVDGWHLPMRDVLRVARATIADRDIYAAEQARIAAEEAAQRRVRVARLP